jgi:hypothetical protein
VDALNAASTRSTVLEAKPTRRLVDAGTSLAGVARAVSARSLATARSPLNA